MALILKLNSDILDPYLRFFLCDWVQFNLKRSSTTTNCEHGTNQTLDEINYVPMPSSTSGNKVGRKTKKGKRGALRDIMNEERSNTSSSNPTSESTTKSNRGAKRKTVVEEPPERSMINDKER